MSTSNEKTSCPITSDLEKHQQESHFRNTFGHQPGGQNKGPVQTGHGGADEGGGEFSGQGNDDQRRNGPHRQLGEGQVQV